MYNNFFHLEFTLKQKLIISWEDFLSVDCARDDDKLNIECPEYCSHPSIEFGRRSAAVRTARERETTCGVKRYVAVLSDAVTTQE